VQIVRIVHVANNEGGTMMNDKLLSPNAVAALTSLHRTSIYRKVQAGEFPAPVRLSTRRIGFREAEVQAWIAKLEAA
jgi:prophage regulatory protein